jgi:hypothetical protein
MFFIQGLSVYVSYKGMFFTTGLFHSLPAVFLHHLCHSLCPAAVTLVLLS